MSCSWQEIFSNFVLEKMQLLHQFTEHHLYDGILNDEQFGIHGGDKAFFWNQKFSFLLLSSIKTLENEDE